MVAVVISVNAAIDAGGGGDFRLTQPPVTPRTGNICIWKDDSYDQTVG